MISDKAFNQHMSNIKDEVTRLENSIDLIDTNKKILASTFERKRKICYTNISSISIDIAQKKIAALKMVESK